MGSVYSYIVISYEGGTEWAMYSYIVISYEGSTEWALYR